MEESSEITTNEVLQAIIELEGDRAKISSGKDDGSVRTKEIVAATGLSNKKVRAMLFELKQAGVIEVVMSNRETLRGIVPVQCYRKVRNNANTNKK